MAQKKSNHIKTRGLMSVDKSRTSPFMKIVLLVIAATMVLSFIPVVGSLFSSSSTGTTAGSATVNSEAAAEAQYQPQVDALEAKLATTPDDRASLVSLGNTYFDWANALSGVVSDQAGQDKVSSYFALAADAYEKAIAIKGDESPVEVDYAFALYNSGETTKAVSISEAVTEKDPTFSMSWFSLGLFKMNANDNVAAKAAFEKYLELDVTNQYGNRAAAQQYVDSL